MPEKETADVQSEEEGEETPPGADGRFDSDYVSRLRAESAERRIAARAATEATTAATARADSMSARLLDLEIAAAAGGLLADPSDLLAHVDAAELVDDDGNPSAEKIKSAAVALVERKGHLAKGHLAPRPGPAGDVDQGPRAPTGPVFDFAEVLRRAAN